MAEKYRIGDVDRIKFNGRCIKIFEVFEYSRATESYIHCGRFEAPADTPDDKLYDYIPESLSETEGHCF